jgi:hypothetical protein
MAAMSRTTFKELIMQTRMRFCEINRADRDEAPARRRRRNPTARWKRAAKETAPAEWIEVIGIRARASRGGSDLSSK